MILAEAVTATFPTLPATVQRGKKGQSTASRRYFSLSASQSKHSLVRDILKPRDTNQWLQNFVCKRHFFLKSSVEFVAKLQ